MPRSTRLLLPLLRSTSSSRESRWGEAINHRAANAKLRQPEISFLPSEYRGPLAHPLTIRAVGSFPSARPRSTIDFEFSAYRSVYIYIYIHPIQPGGGERTAPICAFFPIRFLPLTDTLSFPLSLINRIEDRIEEGKIRNKDERSSINLTPINYHRICDASIERSRLEGTNGNFPFLSRAQRRGDDRHGSTSMLDTSPVDVRPNRFPSGCCAGRSVTSLMDSYVHI